ncbi:MAG: hypothetical protein ACRDZZ_15380 [Ilumatobacteraceae bacterium]
MTDLDELARRAVDGVTRLASRAMRFAGFVFVVAALVGTVSFLLGLAALDGGIRTVWIVLGLFFGGIAVGGSFLARWRLGSVRRHANALVAEVRSLLETGHAGTRTVIETFEADERRGGDSVLVVSRDFFSLRDAVGNRVADFRKLTSAVTAVTSFPGLVLSAIAITLVFAVLAPIFLLALAL